MDRIYYFMLAKEESERMRLKKRHNRRTLPIFQKVIGPYEVYYLQMYGETEKHKLAGSQAYMAKGIQRMARVCDVDATGNAYLVYDAEFEKWLHARQKTAYWQKLWNLPLYHEYKEAHNLPLLLQQLPENGCPGQLVILGEAPGLQEWIGGMARYMQDITFFATEKPKGFEAVREQMLEEYGLLVSWEKHMQPVSQRAALVLDYSGKEKLYIWGIPRGSTWVDMTSMEQRRHALEDRDTGIQYISLKSIWRGEMLQTLDTASKIQYNTEVKLDGKVGL